MHQLPRSLLFSILIVWASREAVWSQVIISEFMASNAHTLSDADFEHPDWFEVFNHSDEVVDLKGWTVTDDVRRPDKWTFPRFVLATGEFRVVFASGKNQRDPNRELHTNFKLSGSGESLALITPDLEVTSLYRNYPAQANDVSYGFGTETTVRELIAAGDVARYFVPGDDSLALSWTATDFDDTSWNSGPTAIGFDRRTSPQLLDSIQTDIRPEVSNDDSSIYLRMSFELSESETTSTLALEMLYDDGFVAFVNGQEIARRNVAEGDLTFQSQAEVTRNTTAALTPETILIPPAAGLLRPGTNVLALQALNRRGSDFDLLIQPALEAILVTDVDSTTPGYFGVPTPGSPNPASPYPGFSEPPVFSELTGVYTEPFSLEITASSAGSRVHVTTDGSEPTGASPPYTGRLTIDGPTRVRARSFEPGLLPSPEVFETFVLVDETVLDFDTDLPIIVVSGFRKPTGDDWTPAHIQVIEPGPDGRATLLDAADFSSIGAFKERGSSTATRPKLSFNVEIRHPDGRDRDVEILDMPAGADWILYGAYNFDYALMRNAFIYEIGRQVAEEAERNPGSYAVRTRFCEVYLNRTEGPIKDSHYWGVYSFMERITRGPERVDVAKLRATVTEEPEISGGYILKIDRADLGDSGIRVSGDSGSDQTLQFVDPKEEEVERAPVQKDWIRDHLTDMVGSFSAPDADDPLTGYEKYIDVQSWIDHSWLNVLAMNVDAFRLSAYLHKERDDRVVFGPLWDFDRSMGSTDGRDGNPEEWSGTSDATKYFDYIWWKELHANPGFQERWDERWLELRRNVFSDSNLLGLIDRMAAKTAEAWPRNKEKWKQGSTQADAVEVLKDWLTRRTRWIDSQVFPGPDFSPGGGPQTVDLDVDLSSELVDDGVFNAEIYYTINGPDPRGDDGQAAPEAVHYTEPIRVSENTLVRARLLIGEAWGRERKETYYFTLAPIVITEIMYNPTNDPDPNSPFRNNEFEFVELQNIGDQPVDLDGLHFDPEGEITFTFDSLNLAPGEHVVVASDAEALAARHGTAGIRVAGEFEGFLRNSGMNVTLLGSRDEPLMDFDYSGDWYPSTNKGGFSLVIRDPTAPRESWNDAASWRASLELNGSPGRADGGEFHRPGDFTGDGRLNLADPLGSLLHIFRGKDSPCATEEATLALLDTDGSQTLNLGDVLWTLRYIFGMGLPPMAGNDCVPISGCGTGCGG